MNKVNLDSEEWKKKLKDKSPEEIAEIVGSYYEDKYGMENTLPLKKIIGIVFFISVLILVFAVF